MLSNRYPIIAREGWILLMILIIIGILLAMKYTLIQSTPAWGLFVILLFLFRDPSRRIPSSPLAVVSPIDGQIVDISSVHDQWLDRPAKRVQISTSYFSTFALRSPIEGKVVRNWSSEPVRESHGGKTYRHSFWLKSDEEDDVLTAIYIGKIASKMRFYAHPGERLGQGQRCGYFFLGGLVEVYLPDDASITVKAGDRVLSGSSVLGKVLTHQPPMTEYTQKAV